MKEGHRILCVDDEEGVVDALERVFFDENWQVVRAREASEALRILEGTEVSVIISDYRMPGISGVDLLRLVSKRWPKPIRIVLSGYAEAHAIVSAINEGHIYKFVPKPWDDNELLVTIRRALEKFELDRENERLHSEVCRKNQELASLNETLEEKIRDRTRELQAHADGLRFAREVLDDLPYALIGIDAEGMVVLSNKGAPEMFSELGPFQIGAPIDELLSPEICDTVKGVLREGRFQSTTVQVGNRGMVLDCQPLGGKPKRGAIILLRERDWQT